MARDTVKEVFAKALDLPADAEVEKLELGQDPRWDSLGHMALVAEIEERFEIMLETDDVVAMTSFETSLEILRRHGVAA